MSNCQSVYQHGNDQYICTRCGYNWDRDDEAPACKTNADLERETIDKLRAEVSNAPKCQVCFETEATMQHGDGTYCCGSCLIKLNDIELKLSAHCEHGRPMNCYCAPCGRIHGGE